MIKDADEIFFYSFFILFTSLLSRDNEEVALLISLISIYIIGHIVSQKKYLRVFERIFSTLKENINCAKF